VTPQRRERASHSQRRRQVAGSTGARVALREIREWEDRARRIRAHALDERREADAGLYDHRTEETPEEMAWLESQEVDW